MCVYISFNFYYCRVAGFEALNNLGIFLFNIRYACFQTFSMIGYDLKLMISIVEKVLLTRKSSFLIKKLNFVF